MEKSVNITYESSFEWLEGKLSTIDDRLEVSHDGWYYRIYNRDNGNCLGSLTYCYEEDSDIWGEWWASDGCEYTDPKGWVEWVSQHYQEGKVND